MAEYKDEIVDNSKGNYWSNIADRYQEEPDEFSSTAEEEYVRGWNNKDEENIWIVRNKLRVLVELTAAERRPLREVTNWNPGGLVVW